MLLKKETLIAKPLTFLFFGFCKQANVKVCVIRISLRTTFSASVFFVLDDSYNLVQMFFWVVIAASFFY